MQQLTEAIIWKHIRRASSILRECVPSYKEPIIVDVARSKAESYWGQVRKLTYGYGIRVSKAFERIPTAELFEERLTSCMIHELIHTQRGCMNHKENFKRLARMVNNKYPQYKINTGTSEEDYGIVSKTRTAKWVCTCQTCGTVSYYARRPKYYMDMNTHYSCTKCKTSNFLVRQVHN